MQAACQLLVLLAILAISATAAAVMIGVVSKDQVFMAVKKFVLLVGCGWASLWAAGCLIDNYIAPTMGSVRNSSRTISAWIVPVLFIVVIAGAIIIAARKKNSSH